MIKEHSEIALNFFPLITQNFEFTVYRKSVLDIHEERPHPECKRWNLPPDVNHAEDYLPYWTCYEERDDFEKFICNQSTNNELTRHFLFSCLKASCKKLGEVDFEIDERSFSYRIAFQIASHPKRRVETVWLEPYFLKATAEFGFLADFKLILPSNERMDRRDLELSLTHKNGRQNKDFYIDRFEKLKVFIKRYYGSLFPLETLHTPIEVDRNLRKLITDRLKPKKYVFANERLANSQFAGIKTHGPLSSITDPQKIYFVYREQDKPFSYDLYRALNGKSFQTFEGMERIFHFNLDNTTVTGIPVSGFDDTEIEKVCKIIDQDDDHENKGVPILLVPFNKFNSEKDTEAYFRLKHKFLEHGIASQCVTINLLKSENTLKWSAANIALQVFAKLGGEPWKVQPANDRCLIIGLGQAHKRRKVGGKVEITKYFAYTVLTDSSGLYKDLVILGSDSDETSYLKGLKNNLTDVIKHYGAQFDRFVIHATYSIRREEITAIEDLIDEIQNGEIEDIKAKEFVVMKLNDKNKYFGYATANNSLVPYESTYLKLSEDEFLVWFEGLQLHTSANPKRIERPVHVAFLHTPDHFTDEDKKSYLQDCLNLSGANWRGFNARSFPISVFYAKEISRYIKEFRSLQLDDEKIDWSNVTPWFL